MWLEPVTTRPRGRRRSRPRTASYSRTLQATTTAAAACCCARQAARVPRCNASLCKGMRLHRLSRWGATYGEQRCALDHVLRSARTSSRASMVCHNILTRSRKAGRCGRSSRSETTWQRYPALQAYLHPKGLSERVSEHMSADMLEKVTSMVESWPVCDYPRVATGGCCREGGRCTPQQNLQQRGDVCAARHKLVQPAKRPEIPARAPTAGAS